MVFCGHRAPTLSAPASAAVPPTGPSGPQYRVCHTGAPDAAVDVSYNGGINLLDAETLLREITSRVPEGVRPNSRRQHPLLTRRVSVLWPGAAWAGRRSVREGAQL